MVSDLGSPGCGLLGYSHISLDRWQGIWKVMSICVMPPSFKGPCTQTLPSGSEYTNSTYIELYSLEEYLHWSVDV